MSRALIFIIFACAAQVSARTGPGRSTLRCPDNESAFYADKEGRAVSFVATLSDGNSRIIRRTEVKKYWGKENGIVLMSDGVDVCTLDYAWKRGLNKAIRPIGRDLSDKSGWPNIDVPPGVLAVDPRLGRFKFYEGKSGPLRDGPEIRLPHGNSFGFVIKGKYLFQAGGESVRDVYVVDISDPAKPKWVAHVPSRGFCAYAVGLVGDHLIVSCRERMQIVDISDPLHPKRVAEYSDRISPMKIQTQGNLVFVICRSLQKMNIVDLSDPRKPTTLYQYYPGKNGGRVYDMIPNGKYLYLYGTHPGKGGGMLVLDISDPKNPVEIAFHPGVDIPSAYINKNWIHREKRLIGFQPSGRSVKVLDITDPRKFKTIWTEEVNKTSAPRHDSTGSVAIQGNTIFVASGSLNYEEGSLKVYEADDNLKNWKLVGAYKGKGEICRGPYRHGMAFSRLTPVGNYLLASRATYGLLVFDISNHKNPRLINGLPLAGECFGVAVAGNRAYAAMNFGGLAVIDLKNRRVTKTVRGPISPLPWGVAAQGNYAFAARKFIVDATDINNPKYLAPIAAHYDNGITVDGNRLFYGNGGTLTMTDITDPSKPKVRSNTNIGTFFGLAVRGRHLFVGHRKKGLQVYDVSDMTKPKLVAENGSQGGIKRIAVAGNVLVAGKVTGRNRSELINLYDISDALNPRFVSEIRGECNFGLAAKGDYFYAASYYHGSQWLFFDMKDIKNPKQIWSRRAYHPTGITVDARYIYASSLPSITIFDAPITSEAPRGRVTVSYTEKRIP